MLIKMVCTLKLPALCDEKKEERKEEDIYLNV